MTPNGIEIFNPLEHGIHDQPLMVPAHEYNRMLGVLVEARAYIARHTTPTVTEAAHGSIVDRIDAITAPRQASNTVMDGHPQNPVRTDGGLSQEAERGGKWYGA